MERQGDFLMRRLLTTGSLLLSAMSAFPQSGSPAAPETPADQPGATRVELPDSPGMLAQQQQSVVAVAEAYDLAEGIPPPCRVSTWRLVLNTRSTTIRTTSPADDGSTSAGPSTVSLPDTTPVATQLCPNLLNPYARFLDTTMPIPMTPAEKGMLAIRDVLDPFNFLTVFGSAAITIAVDPHTAYGPGLKGFGKLSGVSLLQVTTGEFFGTFVIPSIVHEDPHYHRMPHGTVPRRILHAVSRTVIAQSDYGNNMPNYATLLTYPINAELSNFYVPGIESDASSTTKRIFTSYALDPVGNLITEFLPDLASRVHIRIIVVQRILNQISSTPGGTAVSSP
jgi:hypothetical protein